MRKKVQANLPAEERKYFKRSKRLLCARMANLSDKSSKEALELMLQVSPELRSAYLLKEKFFEMMDSKSHEEAKKKASDFFIFASVTDVPEFKPCVAMLTNRLPYILNAFDCRYSNGFTEGVNNTVKVIKRIAYGCHKFDSFRCRILAVVNGF